MTVHYRERNFESELGPQSNFEGTTRALTASRAFRGKARFWGYLARVRQAGTNGRILPACTVCERAALPPVIRSGNVRQWMRLSSGTDDPNSLARPSWTVSKRLESNKPRVPERMRFCTAGSDNIGGISTVPIIVEKITKKFFSLFCFRRLPMPSVYEDRPSRHASTPDQSAVRQLWLSPRSYQECRGRSHLSH